MLKHLILILVPVLMWLVVPAQAQIESPARPRPIERDTTESTGGTQDLIRQANSFLIRRDAASAIPMLEEAYGREPSPVLNERLRQAYEEARRYDDALRLLDELLDDANRTVYILAEKGRLEYRAGNIEAATQTWEEAIALRPRDGETYRLVSEATLQAEAHDLALAFLERGREAVPNDDTLVLQLGRAAGESGDLERSIGFYLSFLKNRPEQVGFLKSRLGRLLDVPEAPAVFRTAIDDAVRDDPFNRAYRELSAWLALSEGDFETALDAALAIDRISNENGETVLAYAESAAQEGALDVAENALNDLLTRHGDGPIAASARLERARIADLRVREAIEDGADGSRVTPLADTARDAYQEFLDEHPGHPGVAEAQRRLAALYRSVYEDAEAADTLLSSLAETARDPRVSAEALLELGGAAIIRGDLYAARQHFESVKDRIRTGDLADRARFELAQIDFYEGYFFTALSRLDAIDDNTAANVTNDAISLRVTLTENIDPDSTAEVLTAYAQASLLIRRGHEPQAIHVLDSLAAASPYHPILDDVRFTKGRALLASGSAKEAASEFEGLSETFPDSFFADRALLLLGDIREGYLDDAAGAQEAYLQLLERHPGSLFAPEARDRLRALRESAPNS